MRLFEWPSRLVYDTEKLLLLVKVVMRTREPLNCHNWEISLDRKLSRRFARQSECSIKRHHAYHLAMSDSWILLIGNKSYSADGLV